jgi:ElaB/YqjD/DUF883 family membrane-anchored ribosome-binding protein
VAGYVHRSTLQDMLADAEQQMKRSPEAYLVAAAAIGLLAGTLLRYRR